MDTFACPLLVVSPHLDDAVLSCGAMLAQHPDSWVLTVFAGAPPLSTVLTDWDAAAGFDSAAQAMTVRREEDAAALRVLSARARRLEFLDSQYGATHSVDALCEGLAVALRQVVPATVCFPAGLFHSDHALVHAAALALRRLQLAPGWVMYEEALYRRVPGALQQRLAGMAADGIVATPLSMHDDGPSSRKRDAVLCYRSQLRALAKVANGHDDAFAPEGYWRLETQHEWRAARRS